MPTVLESSAPTPTAGAPRKTVLATSEDQARVDAAVRGSSGSVGAKTTWRPSDAAGPAPASASSPPGSAVVSNAKLVGFLVSYSWDPTGRSYAFHDGKTVFGSSASVDHALANDRAMSGQHFAVMVRNGEVRIKDLDTTNATRVDDKEIWGESCPAQHGSIVRAGDTLFVVVLIPLAGRAA